VIQAALWAIAGMKLTTGTGAPCNGDEFRNSSTHLDDVVKTLMDADPHPDRWDGTASQVYKVVNDEHMQLAGDAGDADLKVAAVLDNEAEQVTSTRNTLDEVSKNLSDYDLATCWMNAFPASRAVKLAADLAAVAVAMPICTFTMEALIGHSIANAMQINDYVHLYANAANDTTGDPSSCDIFPNFDQRKLPDLGSRHPERLPDPDAPFEPPSRSLPGTQYTEPGLEEPRVTPPAIPFGAPAPAAPSALPAAPAAAPAPAAPAPSAAPAHSAAPVVPAPTSALTPAPAPAGPARPAPPAASPPTAGPPAAAPASSVPSAASARAPGTGERAPVPPLVDKAETPSVTPVPS
jgi:hypothetical protein